MVLKEMIPDALPPLKDAGKNCSIEGLGFRGRDATSKSWGSFTSCIEFRYKVVHRVLSYSVTRFANGSCVVLQGVGGQYSPPLTTPVQVPLH